ncbi:MAG: hypothetical protein IJG38_02155 [Thermoguttaceae bacterium]|nr:hypothetical protein [Thermoguttaceae bacterium]
MGTRCNIVINGDKCKHILYGCCDGYPETAGTRLKSILDSMESGSGDELATRIVQHREPLYYPPPTSYFYPFEIASAIHQDIEYLYVIDVRKRTVVCYSTANLIGTEMTEESIIGQCRKETIPERKESMK